MKQIIEFLDYIYRDDSARLVILMTMLAMMVFVAIYLVQRARGLVSGGTIPDPAENLTDFREMKEKGLIDEQEFRRVRKVITQPPTAASAPVENSGETSASS